MATESFEEAARRLLAEINARKGRNAVERTAQIIQFPGSGRGERSGSGARREDKAQQPLPQAYPLEVTDSGQGSNERQPGLHATSCSTDADTNRLPAVDDRVSADRECQLRHWKTLHGENE